MPSEQTYIDPVWWYLCIEDIAAGETVVPNDRLKVVTKVNGPAGIGSFVALTDAACGEQVCIGEVKYGVLRSPVASFPEDVR